MNSEERQLIGGKLDNEERQLIGGKLGEERKPNQFLEGSGDDGWWRTLISLLFSPLLFSLSTLDHSKRE